MSGEHPKRWSNLEQASNASDAFRSALDALIAGDGQRGDLTEPELLARRLGSYLGATIALGLSEDWVPTLRTAIAAFEREETLTERRAPAVQSVSTAGEQYLAASSDTERHATLVRLAQDLESCDEGLLDAFGELDWVPLTVDLSWLAARLGSYDPSPKGKTGKKGAATILAEVIALDLDVPALGLHTAEEEDAEDAIDRFRKVLDKAVVKARETNTEAAENTP